MRTGLSEDSFGDQSVVKSSHDLVPCSQVEDDEVGVVALVEGSRDGFVNVSSFSATEN